MLLIFTDGLDTTRKGLAGGAVHDIDQLFNGHRVFAPQDNFEHSERLFAILDWNASDGVRVEFLQIFGKGINFLCQLPYRDALEGTLYDNVHDCSDPDKDTMRPCSNALVNLAQARLIVLPKTSRAIDTG
jgi:hypothetical protein